MADKKISQLTAGASPYAAGTLFEVSVPDGGGGYNSRSARQDGLSFTLGATQIALSGTATTVAGLTLSGASVWHGGTIAVLYGGTGQTTYTNGQLLIGNTSGNTLAKGTLTAPASGIAITNGAGSITFSLNDDLAALEALSSTGIAARTATSTWALRTLTGSANRLTVTNGTGVAGDPTLDISASYVGQATITTLGTVTTGTWQASVVVGLYGGTGVANSGKTITLGGNLVTSGAFATTLTVTAITNSTLPAGTHTLAGLDVIQTWSVNQSFNSGNFLLKGATSGTLTLNAAAIAGANTITWPAGTTDFSATGATGAFVKQASAGAAFTVAVPTIGELAGLGTGVATFLATPTSANFAAAVTGETGTAGGVVFSTAPTISTLTLTGITTLTGSGSITAAGELGIGGTPSGFLDITGTYTTTNANVMRIRPTFASSNTGTQSVLNMGTTITPTGGSLGSLAVLNMAPTLNTNALNIATALLVNTSFTLGAGYSGTITSVSFFNADTPTVSGGAITNFNQFNAGAVSLNDNLASGSVINRQFRATGISSGAAGGTVNNRAAELTVPSGGASSGTANNRGLYITGNGGVAAGGTVNNFAIFSDSTAASQLGTGLLQFGGSTSSFPAVKRSSAILAVRLADDSADAAITASTATASANGSNLLDQIRPNYVICTAQLDKATNTTLATATGLSIALVAGKTYFIKGWLSTTSGASGGLKIALIASGGLTATSARFQAFAWNGTTAVANTTVTALASNIVANTAIITDVYIEGSIVVNAAGTVNVQMAQNASDAATSSIFAGSTFAAVRIN